MKASYGGRVIRIVILHSDNKELNDFVFATQLTRKIKGLVKFLVTSD
jgi:hypothetical protein